jgi:hypothetical protein
MIRVKFKTSLAFLLQNYTCTPVTFQVAHPKQLLAHLNILLAYGRQRCQIVNESLAPGYPEQN